MCKNYVHILDGTDGQNVKSMQYSHKFPKHSFPTDFHFLHKQETATFHCAVTGNSVRRIQIELLVLDLVLLLVMHM